MSGITVETAGFEGLGFTGVDLTFRARIENPNPKGIDVAPEGEAVFGGVPVPVDLSASILPGG